MSSSGIWNPGDNMGTKTQGEADKKPEIQNKGEPVAEKAAAGQVEAPG